VSGLIVANDGDITPQMVVQLEDAAIPLVLIENHVEGHRLPSILGDNFTAGYTVTRHLLSLGHSEIAVPRALPSTAAWSTGCAAVWPHWPKRVWCCQRAECRRPLPNIPKKGTGR
jgi:hypothetical protein